MSHDIDITDTESPKRDVHLSFTAGGAGCWIFVQDEREEPPEQTGIRLDGDSGEALRVALAILNFYADDFLTMVRHSRRPESETDTPDSA